MIRSLDNTVEVAWVPKHQLRTAINVFKQHIYTGAELDTSIKLGELIIDLFNGVTRLGIIYQVNPFKPVGSWFSDIRIDKEENVQYITIYGLSGSNPNKWAGMTFQLIETWALEENCHSYRWYGRLGWTRYEDDIKLLKKINSREGLFEKVISP